MNDKRWSVRATFLKIPWQRPYFSGMRASEPNSDLDRFPRFAEDERATVDLRPDASDAERLGEICRLGPEQLDRLPFGAIKLDRDGTVISYNATESELTGRDPKRVIGRNFFRDVAPCTNVRSFAGRYREGVERGDLHESFRYVFDFRMAPRDVVITLFFHPSSGFGWVFVRALGAV